MAKLGLAASGPRHTNGPRSGAQGRGREAGDRVLGPPGGQRHVTVIGGHEKESTNGVRTLDNEFLTVLLRGVDCAGEPVSDCGSGTGQFRFKGKRRDAVATGTVVVDGATLVNGSTSNAEQETLEDRNRTRT